MLFWSTKVYIQTKSRMNCDERNAKDVGVDAQELLQLESNAKQHPIQHLFEYIFFLLKHPLGFIPFDDAYSFGNKIS